MTVSGKPLRQVEARRRLEQTQRDIYTLGRLRFGLRKPQEIEEWVAESRRLFAERDQLRQVLRSAPVTRAT